MQHRTGPGGGGTLGALVVGVVIGVVSSVVATVLYNTVGFHWGKYRRGRSIRAILNFNDEDDLLVVFAHRENQEQAFLPRMATEDSMAINNLVSALRRTGWSKPIRLRSAQHLQESEKTKNIVALGGPKVNSFTAHILEKMKGKHYDPAFEFAPDEQDPHYWRIIRGDATTYRSKSYEIGSAGAAKNPEEVRDVAIAIKATNPRNSSTKVLVLAGVRGIGTWAAADYLRKYINEIHKKKRGRPGFRKSGDFAALITCTYKNLDIIDTNCQDFIDIS